MDGDIYDQFREDIDRKVPGGVKAEAQRRVVARQVSPATFRLWQEKDDPSIGVEEEEGDEEVTQRLQAGVIKEEPIVIESDDESEGEKVEPVSILLGKMEDLWDKMARYRQKLTDICEEVESWKVGIPKVFLYDSGTLNPAEGERVVPESQDDELEEGEIKEAFREEECDGIYLELGFLLSCEIKIRDASERVQRMRHLYLVKDCHFFVKRHVGNPRRVIRGRNRKIDVIVALHDGIVGGHRGVNATYTKISELYYWDGMMKMVSKSDFAKTAMPRGGREMRPSRRPSGASGGHERHGSYQREHTPEYDDGDIELFLGDFWSYASRRRWTVTRMIKRLRGRGRFAEPIAWIREEVRTWQEVEQAMKRLRPSPVGADGKPIHLQIGNVEEFILAFEQFMHKQGILRDQWMQTLPLWTRGAKRPLAREIRDRARDWEGCRALLREAFRRPEPVQPQPRVERQQRSKRQREPDPREAAPSRRGRKSLARRDEEPNPPAEERGMYPECGLGPVAFQPFTE
ncbi:hypothetical protein CBR_g13020 [Chara braunii]|uniref:Integrase zinc-binding domain-containing protein n=1 Tax=Chara braunii TaxID=69332 RepID=A0A388KTA8_CHABU|nr:hypothetical protein CBR_g13020 [Chara braunii]|eukprot:GBG73301.1 hypothetical protein CBR_g13020 [Chara braunii]